jgi:nitrate/TMAO reductase-like tetraheme cytochrome c subunit
MIEDQPAISSSSRFNRLRNWLSLAGMVLCVSAAFAFILLFAVDLFATHANPYMGILAYVVAPMFFFMGLALVLGGYFLESRRIRKGVPRKENAFVLNVDLSRKRDRRLMVGFVGGSLGFLMLTAFGSYETYHLMETNSFCGETCHTPMEPEYKAYQHSAHAQVDCVACHIGPGTTAYIRTKLNGVKQMYHQILGDYDRPIQILNPNLRLAQETCQTCHWSQKHFGDVPKTFRHYLADEENTPFTVHMILKVGGSDPVHGPVEGIHSHMNVSNKIEFISLDEHREEIPWVRVTDANGKSTEYRTEKFTDDISKHVIRTMDCMDCHNRPAHKFLSPNDAVDQAMAMGRIDVSIPWAKSNIVKALAAPYSTREEAQQKIAESLRAEYKDDKRVDSLVAEVGKIYATNFFPEMKADWRAHPDHIGHKDNNGCFRCHDGMHMASDGKTSIKGSDCNACHLIVAQGAGEELEKVNRKGFDFFHVDSEYSEPNCAECHNGEIQKE